MLRGPPGSGKSDLALRLIEAGARLVSDDQTVLARRGAVLVASAPPSLRGRLEVRGIGICAIEALPSAGLSLVAELVPPHAVERMPAPAFADYLGVGVRIVGISPFEISASAKVRLALDMVRLDIGDDHDENRA